MKETDMELQAIREKLLTLKAEPTAGDPLTAPWAAPRKGSTAAQGAGPQPTHGRQQTEKGRGPFLQRLRSQRSSGELPVSCTGRLSRCWTAMF